jgi:DNA-binding CsgD family transcriptional regulator
VSTAAEAVRQLEVLERDGELAALGALVEASARGEGSLAVIEGTAGIGKTRLVLELRRRLPDGVRVLSARAGELEGEFAFGIVRQLFEPLLAAAGDGGRTELLAGAAALAAPLFDASSLAASTDADSTFAMLHGLYWLAANTAFDRPTLLLIDDLHWADDPSLRWLCYLARRLEGLPLAVVGAMRPPEQGRNPELLTELLTDPAATAVRPGPLTPASIGTLAGVLMEDEADEAFCTAVEAATRGNPLFVLALLDTVAKEGVKPNSDQAHVLLELGPRVVGRAVALRLARLPAEAKALLEAGSIFGDGTSLGQVGALAGLDAERAARAARQLVLSDLWVTDNPIEFFHPVVRTAIYEDLDALARSEGHRRAARLIVESGGLPEHAAAHLLSTVAGEDPFVVSTLRAAAGRSLAQGAPEAAAGYLTRALEEALDPPMRAVVLEEIGLAKRLIDPNAAIEHLRAALELRPEPGRRAEIALEIGGTCFYTGRIPEAIEHLARALEETPRAEHPDLVERLDAEYVASTWWAPESFKAAEARLTAYDLDSLHGGYGSDLLLADLAFLECRLVGDRERAAALARRAFVSGKLVVAGTLGFHFAAYAFTSAGLFDEAIAAYDAGLIAAEKRGDLVSAAPILIFRGRTKVMRGDLEAGLADLQAGLDQVIAYEVGTALPYGAAWVADAQLERGDIEAARAALDTLGLYDELPVNGHLFFFQQSRGRYRMESGEVERGLDDLMVLGERARVVVPFDNPVDYPWRRFAANALFRLGRTAEAVELADENLELARRWGVPSAIGSALRASGLARGGPEGEALLRESVEVLRGANARLELAKSLVELGAALRRGNSRSEAREFLREGVEVALRAGAGALVGRGNEEIAATGARPRAVILSGVESLTASERRVAELAAAGQSNKDIAQALFVTVKTVEMHLSSVYRKLRISSRRELTVTLAGTS